MAATVLVREVLRRASKLLNDYAPAQFLRFPEQECVDFLNDGQLAIAKYLPAASSRLDAIKLKPGTRQSLESIAAVDCKPGDASVPAAAVLGTQLLGVTRNMGVDGLTPGRAIRPVDRKMLDTQDPDWHLAARAKTVVSAFTYDPVTPLYFYVTPPVHATTAVWVEFSYNAQPIKIPNTGAPGTELYLADGANATVISLRDEYVDDLVNYVVARCNMKDSEWSDANKATYFEALFVNSLNAKVTALTGTNPNLKRLPFAPEPIGAAS